jgi:hypothetical protein
MWPFRTKHIVDADASAWLVENFSWLIQTFGQNGMFLQQQLVLPKPGYFTFDGESGHALAERVFAQVKAYCGLRDWAVSIIADHNPAAAKQAWSPTMISHGKYNLGTFEYGSAGAVIVYEASLVSRPEQLIATLAHELSHYLLSTEAKRVCEPDEEEFLTDLCGVFLGFGVFLANARVHHQTITDGISTGWQMSHSGYLPENDLIFALALFIEVKDLDERESLSCLKPHLASLLKRALRGIRRRPAMLAELREAMAVGEDRRAIVTSNHYYAWRARAEQTFDPFARWLNFEGRFRIRSANRCQLRDDALNARVQLRG